MKGFFALGINKGLGFHGIVEHGSQIPNGIRGCDMGRVNDDTVDGAEVPQTLACHDQHLCFVSIKFQKVGR